MTFRDYEHKFNLKATNTNAGPILKDVKKERVLLLENAEADDTDDAGTEPMEMDIKQVDEIAESTKTNIWSRASKHEGKYACDTVDCDYRSRKLWNLKAHCLRKSHNSSHFTKANITPLDSYVNTEEDVPIEENTKLVELR